MVCPSCHAPAPEGNRFCGQCGASLTPAVAAGSRELTVAPRRSSERRQMTVLFYDLVGSTALAARCDPEEFSDAVDLFHSKIASAVEDFGGFVGSRVGDGAIVYFGYPRAQEDAAECAVRAGLRITEVVAEVKLPDASLAQVRVGVATGQGVVSHSQDRDGGNEVVGAVAHLAARLQNIAGPGDVVISDATRKLVEDLFELEDLGRVEARGFQSHVPAWRVTGGQAQSRLTARQDDGGVLVGREPAVSKLTAALEDAAAGSGRVVLLTGDVGLGKSRLVAELATQAKRRGVLRIDLDCAAHAQATPLHPFVGHLQRLRHVDGSASGGCIADTSDVFLAIDTPQDDATLLMGLLGHPVKSAALQQLAASQRLDRTIDALIRQLDLLSSRRPVLVVFEDAHWADPTSLVLIERAIRNVRLGHALLVITARPEFRPSWRDDDVVESIILSPLSPADGVTLIQSIDGAGQLAAATRDAILARSDGVPLFIEELTRGAVDTAMDGSAPERLSEVPMTLQDSLLARLDRLGVAKAIAQVAAVVGRRFDTRVVAALSDRSEAELRLSLERLSEASLIVPERSSDGHAFVFRHVLIREAAYGALLKGERRRLNARLIDVIAAGFPEIITTEPERLAQYADEANLPAVAADYWLKAGSRALAQSAMPEAISRLKLGLASVLRLPESAMRARLELDLQLALGKALIATVGYAVPETGATFERGRVLCQAIGEKPQLLAVLHGLWIHDLLCGRLHSARARGEELLDVARAEQDQVWTLVGRRLQGVLDYALGNFQSSRAALERGLELFDPNRRPEYGRILVDDIRVIMRMYLAWDLIYADDLDHGLRISDLSLSEARLIGQPYTLAHALSGRILSGLFSGKYDGLAARLDELATLTRQNGIKFYGAVCEVLRGRYLVETGAVKAGAGLLEHALGIYRSTESVLYLPTFLMWLADAQVREGRIGDALDRLSEAESLMTRTGMCNDAAELWRLRGDVHRIGGDVDEARTDYQTAIGIAERQGAALFARRARAGLGELRDTEIPQRAKAARHEVCASG